MHTSQTSTPIILCFFMRCSFPALPGLRKRHEIRSRKCDLAWKRKHRAASVSTRSLQVDGVAEGSFLPTFSLLLASFLTRLRRQSGDAVAGGFHPTALDPLDGEKTHKKERESGGVGAGRVNNLLLLISSSEPRHRTQQIDFNQPVK